jgi:hypothetical protein
MAHTHQSRGQLRSCAECTDSEHRIDAAAAHTMDKAYRGAYTVRPAAVQQPMDIVPFGPRGARQAQRTALAAARQQVNTDPKRVQQIETLRQMREALSR